MALQQHGGAVLVMAHCCFFASLAAAISSPEPDLAGCLALAGMARSRIGSPLCATCPATTNTNLLADSEEFDMNYLRSKWPEWQNFPC
ncbi:hypothetical protein [Janthinobacterium sp.]|uniref:hypothetical protein n=1 Tax=Janthinobacterium sp. TaxID=1871054 RepID=UPI0028A00096|nr:hypothetical protein [Janthinobacterium sp.]